MRGPASSSLITEHQEKGEKSDVLMQGMGFPAFPAAMSHITSGEYENFLPVTRRISKFFEKIIFFYPNNLIFVE